jgi:hypothetical protein
MPPGGFGGMHPRVGPPPGTGAIGAIVGVAVALAMVGGILAVVLARKPSTGAGAATAATGMPIAQLATLSLKVTPDVMAKVTGVAPKAESSDSIQMEVPLADKTWNRMNLAWDAADPSHVKEVYLYAEAPPQNDAAIRAKAASYLGRRWEKNASYYFGDSWFSYDATSTSARASPKSGSDVVAHWKDREDALWDLLRVAVLGQSVPIPDAEIRDWMARGYTLTALGAVDTTVDVDHAAAMMAAAFPSVVTKNFIGLRNSLAVDHPWFGDAELTWANEKGGLLTDVAFNAPPNADNKVPSQTDLESCVAAIVGNKGKRYEGDHLKGDWSTEWKPAGGGEIRTSDSGMRVTLISHFTPGKMPRAEWTKLMDAIDHCGRGK